MLYNVNVIILVKAVTVIGFLALYIEGRREKLAA